MTKKKKSLPPDLLMSGAFLPYSGPAFIEYLRQFMRPGESINGFVQRIKSKYDPGCYTRWLEGERPHIDILKEIWWNLRHDGCSWTALMRLAHGIECKEPELSEFWKKRYRDQNKH